MKGQSRKSPVLPVALVLIGFTSITGQIVLLREFIVVFNGNELSLGVILANWLLWTALGSGLAGRRSTRTLTPRQTVSRLEVALAVILPLTILAVRAGKLPFHYIPGELPGPLAVFMTSFVALSLFCAVSGYLFAAGSRLFAAEQGSSTARASSTVYLLETAGSGLGGILASVVLIRYLSSLEIAFLLSLLNLTAALLLAKRQFSPRAAAFWITLGVGALVALPFCTRALESFSLGYLWRGFDLRETRNSIYGNLAVAVTGGVKSFFENGLKMFSVPDEASAEEAVHYALLQHSSPRRLLLIGGGMNGSLVQALQHPSLSYVDYVELDPELIALGRRYLAETWGPVESDTRVNIHHVDGRLFLKRTARKYDVILINLPDPQTAQLNRFYTLEFFRDAARRLTPGGIFSFQVSGAENYVSRELADFLRCMNQTLRRVFSAVVVYPGASIHFFASTSTGALTTNPEELIVRLRSRGLQTDYVREYFIPFRLAPDRVQDLELLIKPETYTPVNMDLTPVAYYFSTILWSSRFDQFYRRVFHLLSRLEFGHLAGVLVLSAAATVLAVAWRRRGRRRLNAGAALCAAAMGFTMMALQLEILLAFQAVYGYVYHQLAITIALFMAGMALGSHRSLGVGPSGDDRARRNRRDPLVLVGLHLAAAATSPLLYAVFRLASVPSDPVWFFAAGNVLFPGLALLGGFLGGYQFPVATRLYYQGKKAPDLRPGAVYALDLTGACAGAVLISVYLIPVFGFFKCSLVLAVINLAPAAVVALSLPAITRNPKPA